MTNDCNDCGEYVATLRWRLGYRTCLNCGEAQAKAERNSWCVVQEYTKGNYQFVTSAQAPTTLRQTNPKENRA